MGASLLALAKSIYYLYLKTPVISLKIGTWLMVSARTYWMRAKNDHNTVQNKRANLARYGTVLPYTCPSHDKKYKLCHCHNQSKMFFPQIQCRVYYF